MSGNINVDTKLTDLELEAFALTSIAFALQEAYERGDGDADTYTPGSWLLANLMHSHAEKVKAIHDYMSGKQDGDSE